MNITETPVEGSIIDGKQIAANMKTRIAERLAVYLKNSGLPESARPTLAVILASDNDASKVYVANKEKACNELGFNSILKNFGSNITQKQLLAEITALNNDKNVNGILVQLPLAPHLNAEDALTCIAPEKDVDGLTMVNGGALYAGTPQLIPCTAAGVMEILHATNTEIEGKHAVVIGRSALVGKPTVLLLIAKNATVTACHSRTKNLSEHTKQADILISAVGRRGLITADMVKEGAVVIDVAINRGVDGRLCGDVDFENVKAKAKAITPVPGGVGPLTIACLMDNTLKAFISQTSKK